jgi:hypothetical protein
MTTLSFLAFDVSALGPPWVLALFGLASAGLGLCLGRAVFGRRARRAPAALPTQAPNNLRASPRRPTLQGRAFLSSADPGTSEALECWLVDRSLGGVGLSADRQLQVGSVWQLRAADPSGSAASGRVEVKYCRLHRGRWRLGCQFLDRAG